MNPVLLTGLVLVLLLVICFGIVAAGVIRRYQLRHAMGTFDASLCRPGGRWQMGVCRYRDHSMQWLRVFSLSPWAVLELPRRSLDLLGWREPTDAERRNIPPGTVVARLSHDDDELLLALSRDAYSGLSAWIEAGPSRTVGSWN